MPTVANSNNPTKREIVDLIDGAINVDTYGADGTLANDYTAINDAITAAGVNGIVRFTKGQTYLLDRNIVPLAGQTLIGYGATLKRANMVSTALTGGFSGNDLPVTAGTGTNFRIGSLVALWDTPDETDHSTNALFVTDTQANTVTVSGSSFTGITAATGDQLETACQLISSSANDVKILGFKIDGNGTSYSSGLHAWELHRDIFLSGARCIVADCNFTDAQLEALIISGDGSKVVNNSFVSPGGNAVHISSSDGLLVDGNYFFDSQVYNSDRSNHQDGAISISAAVVDCTVSNNYYDGNNNGLMFIGGFAHDTQNMTIMGNHAKDTTTASMECQGAFTGISEGHTVTGNYFENCVTFIFNDTTGNKRIENISISNNVIKETKVSIDNVDGCGIVGNTVEMLTVTGTGFQVLDCFNVNISGNTIRTGSNALLGIGIDSGGAGLTKNVKVDGNILTGHASATSNLMTLLAQGTNASAVAVTNNTIVSGTNANNVVAIEVRTDFAEVSGNHVDWSGTTGGSNIAIYFNGSFTTGGTCRNNYIKHGTAERALVCTAGSDDMSILGNHFAGGDVDPRGNNCLIQGNLIEDGTLFIDGDTNSIVGNRVNGTSETISLSVNSANNFLDANITTAEISDSGTNNNNTAGSLTLNTTLGAALDNYHGI